MSLIPRSHLDSFRCSLHRQSSTMSSLFQKCLVSQWIISVTLLSSRFSLQLSDFAFWIAVIVTWLFLDPTRSLFPFLYLRFLLWITNKDRCQGVHSNSLNKKFKLILNHVNQKRETTLCYCTVRLRPQIVSPQFWFLLGA